MTDLRNPAWMYGKAVMLVVIGVMSFCLLLLQQQVWVSAVLQAVMIWAFARAYYFAFYVIQHYIDPGFRFSGLLDFMRYVLDRRRSRG